jgi:hypothetical protein
MPRLFIAALVVTFVMGVASLGYVVSKCGAKGLLYGNGAVIVAATGMCDK